MKLDLLKEKAFENRQVKEAYDALESEFVLIDALVKQFGLTQETNSTQINREGL